MKKWFLKLAICLFIAVLIVPMPVFADGDGPTKPKYHVVRATLTIAGNRDLVAYVGGSVVNNFPQAGDRLDIYYEDGHTVTFGSDDLEQMRVRSSRFYSFQEGKNPTIVYVRWNNGQYWGEILMGAMVTGVYNNNSNIESIRYEQNSPIVLRENYSFGCPDDLMDTLIYIYPKGYAGDKLYIKYKGEPEERVYISQNEDEYDLRYVNQYDSNDVIIPGFVDGQEQMKWSPGIHEVPLLYDGVKVAGTLKVTIQEDPTIVEKDKDRYTLPVGTGYWEHEWDNGRVLIEESDGVPGKVLYRCLKHSENCIITGTKAKDPDNVVPTGSSNRPNNSSGTVTSESKAKSELFGVRLTKLTKGKKSFTAKWKKASKKQQKKFTGYQIQYSTDWNFRTGVKTKSTTKKKASKVVIRKLKAKTNYYVRIRRFKKKGGKIVYSDWSNVKKVRTK